MPPYSKKRAADDSGDDEKIAAKASKKSKHGIAADGEDDEGNPFWDLSNKRRVGVSEYRNMPLVNIREYYEKDGKMLPGKKGISLSVAQYTTLLKAVPAINALLQQKGEAVEDLEALGNSAAEPAKKPKKERKASKANIDATSDEEEA